MGGRFLQEGRHIRRRDAEAGEAPIPSYRPTRPCIRRVTFGPAFRDGNDPVGRLDEDSALSGGAAPMAPGSSAPYSAPLSEPYRGAYGDMSSLSPAKPFGLYAKRACVRGDSPWLDKALELGPQRLPRDREDRLHAWAWAACSALPGGNFLAHDVER